MNFKKTLCFLFGLLLGSTLFLPFRTNAQTKDLISVVIIDGFSNHDWKQTTKVTKWILEESGRFKVDINTIPVDSVERLSWSPDFYKYAVVIQNTNNIHNQSLRWPKEAEQNLEKYLANGGGLYILHSANNAFPHWKEYDLMMGLGWRSKDYGYAFEIQENNEVEKYVPGEGEGTGHGERFNALIKILNRHPINRDFPDEWRTVNTEVYSFPRGPAKNISILSYAFDSTATKKSWPVEWVVSYGKGRVYNSSLGHLWEGEKYPPAYRCVGYQTTLVRAVEWLATGEVKHPVPENFPTGTSISLKPKSGFKKGSENK